ncbi:MAG: hypothetical protein ABSG84_05525 [Acidobacteriaceae bacterium]|jgi:hypothetical protein
MKTPAHRAYQKRSLSVLALYFVVFTGTAYLVDRIHPSGWALFAFALFPSLPLIEVFYLTGKYLKAEQDGYKRDLVMRCLLAGAGACLSVNVFAGFLRIFGWHGQTPPFMELFAFCFAVLAAKLTYKIANPLPAE